MENIIGYLAATLTTIAFLPQVIKVIRTKSTQDISLGMYLIFISGVMCWGCYGLILNNLPMILANAVTFILALTILILKIKNKDNLKL